MVAFSCGKLICMDVLIRQFFFCHDFFFSYLFVLNFFGEKKLISFDVLFYVLSSIRWNCFFVCHAVSFFYENL